MFGLFALVTGGQCTNPFTDPAMMALKQTCDGMEKRAVETKQKAQDNFNIYAAQTDRSNREIARRMAQQRIDGFTPATAAA